MLGEQTVRCHRVQDTRRLATLPSNSSQSGHIPASPGVQHAGDMDRFATSASEPRQPPELPNSTVCWGLLDRQRTRHCCVSVARSTTTGCRATRLPEVRLHRIAPASAACTCMQFKLQSGRASMHPPTFCRIFKSTCEMALACSLCRWAAAVPSRGGWLGARAGRPGCPARGLAIHPTSSCTTAEVHTSSCSQSNTGMSQDELSLRCRIACFKRPLRLFHVCRCCHPTSGAR